MGTSLRAGLLLVLGAASAASAQTPIPLTVSGNEAQGTFALPGGIGGELTISFESVTGLSSSALSATATLVDPTDLALRLRLPLLASVPDVFPVLVRIGPAPTSTLAFSGVARVTLYTENLDLDPSLPQGLVKAPDGGFFRDITTSESAGSYRVCGSGGGFSEFLVVVDGQPIDMVIVEKLVELETTLVQHAASMPLLVLLTLQARLVEARALFEAGSIPGAITKITSFSSYVLAHSGGHIPDVWRANDPTTVNVAGLLRSRADSLRFSLVRRSSQ